MFWQKKKLNSDEYETLMKKIIEVRGEIDEANKRYKILETNYDNLRGQFNRKLAGIRREEAQSVGDDNSQGVDKPARSGQSKALNTPGPVVFTGMAYGDIPK